MLYILERAPRKLLETEGPFTQLERWLVNCQSHSKPTNQISSPVLQRVGNSTMLSSDAKGHNLCASLPRAELQSTTVFNKLFPKPVGNRQLLLFSRYYSCIHAVTTSVYKLPAKSYLKPGHSFRIFLLQRTLTGRSLNISDRSFSRWIFSPEGLTLSTANEDCSNFMNNNADVRSNSQNLRLSEDNPLLFVLQTITYSGWSS